MAIMKTSLVFVNVLRFHIACAEVSDGIMPSGSLQNEDHRNEDDMAIKSGPTLVDQRLASDKLFREFCSTRGLPSLRADLDQLFCKKHAIETQEFEPAERGLLHLIQQCYGCQAENVKLILDYYSDAAIKQKTDFDVNRTIEVASVDMNALIVAVQQYDLAESRCRKNNRLLNFTKFITLSQTKSRFGSDCVPKFCLHFHMIFCFKLMFLVDRNKQCNKVVQLLVAHGADVNMQVKNGSYTTFALAQAAAHDNLEVVRMLLDANAEIDLRDCSNRTALSFAAMSGCSKVVDLLLEHGAKVDIADVSGRTPLWLATTSRHEDIALKLIEKGANVNQQVRKNTVLSQACKFKSPQPLNCIAKALLARGANPDTLDADRRSPLFYATQLKDETHVELLLARHAKVGIHDIKGRTPLHEACEIRGANLKSDVKIVKMLLDAGAPVDTCDDNGHSVLIRAC